jgi:hypothetical protein
MPIHNIKRALFKITAARLKKKINSKIAILPFKIVIILVNKRKHEFFFYPVLALSERWNWIFWISF